MARDPVEHGPLPLTKQPSGTGSWQKVLRAAFADVKHKAELLPLAEQALCACPDDGHVLLLTATAALIDRRPARAQVILQRFAKDYLAISAYHPLLALEAKSGYLA